MKNKNFKNIISAFWVQEDLLRTYRTLSTELLPENETLIEDLKLCLMFVKQDYPKKKLQG